MNASIGRTPDLQSAAREGQEWRRKQASIEVACSEYVEQVRRRCADLVFCRSLPIIRAMNAATRPRPKQISPIQVVRASGDLSLDVIADPGVLSKPYYRSGVALVVPQGSPITSFAAPDGRTKGGAGLARSSRWSSASAMSASRPMPSRTRCCRRWRTARLTPQQRLRCQPDISTSLTRWMCLAPGIPTDHDAANAGLFNKAVILAIIRSSGKSCISVPRRLANGPPPRYLNSEGLMCVETEYG